ncbi:polysaccharide biosynthesis/export family protein [Sphingomonas sp. CJ99]
MNAGPIPRALVLVGLMATGGCATLPSAAPTVGQVLAPPDTGPPIRVVDIGGPGGIGEMAAPAPDAWSIADAPPLSSALMPGDRISITVFEIGYALFGSPSAGRDGDAAEAPPGAGDQRLPVIELDDRGEVTLPYIGTVDALGRTTDELATEIEARLARVSQRPQVLVSVERGPMRSVVLSGDIRQPGRRPLTVARERLLDLIAEAGGPANRAADTQVRLTRGQVTAVERLDRIRVDGPANVRLAPGDHVELVRSTRTLTVLGAARSVAEIPFDSDQLTLAEALARAGGPLDERGDARGVFVFRHVIERDADGTMREVPVIYRLNLLDPRSYFAVQRFAMREKDVLLVANARSVQFGKLVQLLNQFVSPAVTVDILTR